MLDFTSALYLGLRHPSRSLLPWSQFTTGVPAALAPPPKASEVAQAVATLQGCERGTLGTSTLHLFWDLFGTVAGCRVAIYMDAGAYPIVRWGVERAAGRRVPVSVFAHHNAPALRRLLRVNAARRLRPLVVTDGFCPGCGAPAPLQAYLDCARAFGGSLIFDDTQALGIFGHTPGPAAPYGHGGGGMLPWSHAGGPDVLVVSSLAKAFGAPLAALCGSQTAVEQFESNSETRMHCSPPSVATIHAAEHALAVNRVHGDSLRLHLADMATRFRHRAAQAGFQFIGGIFPVQTLAPQPGIDPLTTYRRLLDLGIRTVLHIARNGAGPRISFLITARHLPQEIDLAVGALVQALPVGSGANRQWRLSV